MAKTKVVKVLRGRPPKDVKEINPVVQVGRHPENEELELRQHAKKQGVPWGKWVWDALLLVMRLERSNKDEKKKSGKR